jgi:glycosyltransferase involved in cell wall biosynthesis
VAANRLGPMPAFSIVVPAHNEAARIERTLRDYTAAFPDGELIVVLNGCTDGTAAAIARVREATIRCIEIKAPIGKGGAVRAGLLAASAPLVGYADADGATCGSEFRRLFELLRDADVAIGSRWLPGARLDPPQPLSRRAASRAFNLLARVLTGLRVSDTQCGAKAFRAQALRGVLEAVETANFAFDVDLLVALRRVGARVVEMPIEWHDQAASQLRLVPDSLRMLAALLRLTMKRSVLRHAVPFFDRMLPTQHMTMHDVMRLNVDQDMAPVTQRTLGTDGS